MAGVDVWRHQLSEWDLVDPAAEVRHWARDWLGKTSSMLATSTLLGRLQVAASPGTVIVPAREPSRVTRRSALPWWQQRVVQQQPPVALVRSDPIPVDLRAVKRCAALPVEPVNVSGGVVLKLLRISSAVTTMAASLPSKLFEYNEYLVAQRAEAAAQEELEDARERAIVSGKPTHAQLSFPTHACNVSP